jgi:hypothetical protein
VAKIWISTSGEQELYQLKVVSACSVAEYRIGTVVIVVEEVKLMFAPSVMMYWDISRFPAS